MHCRCSYKVNKTTDHSALGDHWSHRAWHAGVRSFSTWLRTKCLFYEQNRSSMCHVIIKIAIAYPRPPIMGTNKQFETNEKIPIAYRCVQTVASEIPDFSRERKSSPPTDRSNKTQHTTHNHSQDRRIEARCHRAFEHPPPTHTPPRSMRRGKKGSNKKGKVRTAHARPRVGHPHRVTAIHGPADVYFRFLVQEGSAAGSARNTLPYLYPVHPRMSRYH